MSALEHPAALALGHARREAHLVRLDRKIEDLIAKDDPRLGELSSCVVRAALLGDEGALSLDRIDEYLRTCSLDPESAGGRSAGRAGTLIRRLRAGAALSTLVPDAVHGSLRAQMIRESVDAEYHAQVGAPMLRLLAEGVESPADLERARSLAGAYLAGLGALGAPIGLLLRDDAQMTRLARVARARSLLRASGVPNWVVDMDPIADAPRVDEALITELSLWRRSGDAVEDALATSLEERRMHECRTLAELDREIRVLLRAPSATDRLNADPESGPGRTLGVVVAPEVLTALWQRERGRAGSELVGVAVGGWNDTPGEPPFQIEAAVRMEAELDGAPLVVYAQTRAGKGHPDHLELREGAPDQLLGAARRRVAVTGRPSSHRITTTDLTRVEIRALPLLCFFQDGAVALHVDRRRLIVDDSCGHPAGSWHKTPDGTAFALACEDCGREQIAVVPRHLHPNRRNMSFSESYLATERGYRVLMGDDHEVTMDDLAAMPTMSMRPSDYPSGAVARLPPVKVAGARRALSRRRRAAR